MCSTFAVMRRLEVLGRRSRHDRACLMDLGWWGCGARSCGPEQPLWVARPVASVTGLRRSGWRRSVDHDRESLRELAKIESIIPCECSHRPRRSETQPLWILSGDSGLGGTYTTELLVQATWCSAAEILPGFGRARARVEVVRGSGGRKVPERVIAVMRELSAVSSADPGSPPVVMASSGSTVTCQGQRFGGSAGRSAKSFWLVIEGFRGLVPGPGWSEAGLGCF